MSATRRVTLLGSTGSIGTQALSVIEANPERFKVVALAAGGSRPDLLAQQAVQFQPEVVAVPDDLSAAAVRRSLNLFGADVPVLVGPDSAASVASRPCDVVLNGMTGAVGLPATLAALRSGATLALANKESLIIGGPLVKALAAPGQIVPVDSEHSALAQCLASGEHRDVRRLVLTASGGPFRGRRRADLADVTPEQAMAHPTWAMGPVITINSATLVNKGLEVIEAHLLFDVPMDSIDVVVHPQSVIHSMVEFVDGSTIAQASPPDMRLPIAQGLAWPQRVPDAVPSVDWRVEQTWTFQPLDEATFPAVALARRAGSVGGTAPAVYNAVNESAVAAFRERRIGFLDIVGLIERVLGEHLPVVGQDFTLDAVTGADAWARARAGEMIDTGAMIEAGEMISDGDAVQSPGSGLAQATGGDAGVRT